MAFQKADKRQGRLRIALTAPSGGGKTYSGLLMATGIVEAMKKLGLDTGKGIAVIDTENGSALDYADRFEFDHLKIDPPYTTPKYVTAMQEAYEGGYAVLFVDSLSHAWAGEGGLLQKKEALDTRGGNSYTNWAGITKEHEQLKAIILSNKIHLICAMRSKQDYIIEQNDKSKSAPGRWASRRSSGRAWSMSSPWSSTSEWTTAPTSPRTARPCSTGRSSSPPRRPVPNCWSGG